MKLARIITLMAYKNLEKVSDIQPDGYFTVSNNEHHFVVIDNGINALFGILRKENFKNKEKITIDKSQMFTVDALERISI